MAKTGNDSSKYLEHLRHSCAHLLAAAIQELYPKSLRTIGPAIENGFYFDFDNLQISEADLQKVEKKMHEIAETWKGFKEELLTKKDALNEFRGNMYKRELIEEFAPHEENLSFYTSVDKEGKRLYWDLCKGGHVENPSEVLKYFKLLSIAGAYWRGNEKNKMLTRIYGTAFPSQKELDEYLKMLLEAEKRNHKKIGQELELFMFHETAPGMAYWLPKGVILYNELIKFWREEHQKRGYQEIFSPILNKKDLYVTSGHYDHYWQDMFVAKTEDGEYGIKSMNCPNAHIVFGSKTRSYRDLPFRLSDTDMLHRYELSGTLNGLLRVREFRQDDAHIYVSEDQIESEYKQVFEIVERFYSVFGIMYSFRLGTRNPENYMGDVETWDRAEKILKKILDDSKKEYFVLDGDGAFYGPKVDILMKDALGRSWQMGTVQLDFQQPRRFKLKYTDKDGKEQTPIAIHRVIYGSLERFIGIITEHFAGAFPTWLSPVQVKILPISEKNVAYCQTILARLKENNVRVELDERNETLGAKIRDAQKEKVPYMLIIGDKEQKAKVISERGRSGKDYGQLPLEEFIRNIKKEIESKSLS